MTEFTLKPRIFDPYLIVGFIILTAFLVAMYFVVGPAKPGSEYIILMIPVALIAAATVTLYLYIWPVTITLSEEGILDSRHGVLIYWEDVIELKAIDLGRYTDWGIGILVKDPMVYLDQVINPWKKFSAKQLFRLSLGYICLKFYGYGNDLFAFESRAQELFGQFKLNKNR